MNSEQHTEHTVAHMFAAFLIGNLPSSTFQRWVFTQYNIADVIGEDIYLNLLDIEYGLSSAKQDVTETIQSVPALQYDRLLRSHIKSILCGLLDGKIPVKSACQQLSWWRETDAPWIPIVFGGIESELGGIHSTMDDAFWNDEARMAKHELYAAIIAYFDHARTEAEEVLRTEYDEPCEQ